MNRLYRSEDDQVLGGVCSGMAEVYDIDPSLVRLATLFAVLLTFPIGLFVYIVAWLIIPLESELEE